MYSAWILLILAASMGDLFLIAEPAAVPSFRRFFTIVLENTNYTSAMANKYLGATLRNKGRLLTNMYGVSHPSEPNYLAMISGSTHGVKNDNNYDFAATVKTIVDVLELRNITWRSYNEKYPSTCSTVTSSGGSTCKYVRKHNPFISFLSIRNVPARCNNIDNGTQFSKDLAANAVPQYVFYVPDLCHDGHDTGINAAATWLQGFLEPLLVHPNLANTAFFIVFDESSEGSRTNQIYGLLVGGGYIAGSSDNTNYNHYSQMATLERRWSLGNIGRNDSTAAAFTQ